MDTKQEKTQGDWLIRSYLLSFAAGIDRSSMYMLRDAADSKSTGSYATSGLVTQKGAWDKKPSWYYVSRLKQILEGYTFNKVIEESNSIYIYKFNKNETNEEVYAIWSPTSNKTEIKNYKLNIGNNKIGATITSLEDNSDNVTKNKLEIKEDKIEIDVSESPVFITTKRIKEEPKIIMGDINNDGKITISDLVKLKKSLISIENLSNQQSKLADLNYDNKVTITDLVILKKVLVGLIKL